VRVEARAECPHSYQNLPKFHRDSLEEFMQVRKFAPKKVAPLQYFFKRFNSQAGKVIPGWGTTPLMLALMLLFFFFLLMLIEIVNASIQLEGIDVDWKSLSY
jgi:photosystem II PsbH protein